MKSSKRYGLLVAALVTTAALLVACSTSPTGRRQLLLFSESEVSKMGIAAYEDMKQKQALSKDEKVNRYVDCVAGAVLMALPGDEGRGWEVTVFEDDSPNAFALPGRKIGVHTGILKTAKNQDQLATVIGHEIGHVEAHHSGERLSVQTTAGAATTIAAVMIGSNSSERNLALAALGAGATVGVILPFSRTHESEADVIGLRHMAKAGFDPRESVKLWQNMAAENQGKAPPEFLSTHPSDATRMAGLEREIPNVMPNYEAARAQGRRPNCKL
jgi:predicted Zn-dependent protease